MRYYIDNFRGLQNQKIISTLANGGAQSNLSKEIIESMFIVVPKEEVLQKFKIDIALKYVILTSKEIKYLNNSKRLIVSKISKR